MTVANEANAATPAQSTDTGAFLEMLRQPDGVFERRAPKCPTAPGKTFLATASGYFNAIEPALRSIAMIDLRLPPGIYVTINLVLPDILARAANKIDWQSKATTSDDQILRRCWLLLDIDPTRPAGISATDAEMEAAIALARSIRTTLAGDGWPEPLLTMSGNGAYLLYRIDLPNDVDSTDLIRRVLVCLGDRFDTTAAKIDRSTFNASRIAKVAGTTARKGSHLAGAQGVDDRPHRKSWFEPPNGKLAIVPQELLEAAAARPVVAQTAKMTGRAGRKRDKMSAVERCRRYLAKLQDAIPGEGGHNRTLQAACECFRFGLSDPQAREMLEWFNTNKTGGEIWNGGELDHKLQDAKAKVEAAGEFGVRLRKRQSKVRCTTKC